MSHSPSSPTDAPGIDLERYSDDVRAIFMAHFSRRVIASGQDPEDVLQEVYRGILARNGGSNPWHPYPGGKTRGAYIYMVCSSVVINQFRQHRRWTDQHQIGCYDRGDLGGFRDVAAADWPDDDALTALEAALSVPDVLQGFEALVKAQDVPEIGLALQAMARGMSEKMTRHRFGPAGIDAISVLHRWRDEMSG